MNTQGKFFGNRNKKNSKLRLIGFFLLLVSVIVVEFTLGFRESKKHLSNLNQLYKENWALARFRADSSKMKVPTKELRSKRILYLSNSHAFTGGRVSKHLKAFLANASPNPIEVLDISDPGIFTPDMLQRYLSTLDYEIDTLIFAPAYISLSDRMRLSRQSFSARSFFNKGVFENLPTSFWVRHYDLALYLEVLVNKLLDSYHYRNEIRNLWEIPLADSIKSITKDSKIRSLEVDENQSWRFPEGFDSNLFDWSLYALGRENHLADLRYLLKAAEQHRVSIIGLNLPIDWEKEPRKKNLADIEEYRTKLRSAFSSVTNYSDFQDWFPVRFTSYDALHPTWQGARLHALDLALRLDDSQQVKLDLEPLLEDYLKSGAQDLEEYQANVGRINQLTSSTSMRRYDIFELKQAQDLLSRVSSSQLGSGLEQRYLIELYLRLRLWSEGKFKFPKHPLYPEIWEKAVKEEQRIALNKVEAFKLAVTELLHTKSSNLIIPDLSEMKPTKSWKISDTPFTVFRYTLGTEQIIDKLVFFEREIAYRVYQGSDLKFHFMKTDLLGDGSFILINTESDRWYFPIWTYTTEPTVDWGI